MKLIKYHISDSEEFLSKLINVVDINADIEDNIKIPFLKSDYFGKIQFGKFTLYSTRKTIIGKKIILKITGKLDSKNYLEYKVKMYRFWIKLCNLLLLIVFGIILIIDFYYIGIAFIIIVLASTSWEFDMFRKEKLKFTTLIENIVK